MSKKQLGILALLGATLFWGGGPVIVKLGLKEVLPYTFAFFRLLIAFLVLLPILLLNKQHKVLKSDISTFVMVGIFGAGINSIFFISGIFRTSASMSAAIFATVPLINSIAAAVFLKEKPTKVRVFGVIVGFIGSFILTLGGRFFSSDGEGGDILGNIFILGAAISWVAYIIISKRLLERYSPLVISTYSFLIGAMMTFPLFYFEILQNPAWYQNIGIQGIISILYGAIFAAVLAFLLFQIGTKYTSAFVAGAVIYLQPVITTTLAIPILGEHPNSTFIIGTGLILAGVFLVTSYEMIKKRKNRI